MNPGEQLRQGFELLERLRQQERAAMAAPRVTLQSDEIQFLLDAIKDFSAFGQTRDDVVRKLRNAQTQPPLQPEDAGVLRGPLDAFLKPDYDEERYLEMLESLQPVNVVALLRHLLCTYPSTRDFLVECLNIAKNREQEFDT